VAGKSLLATRFLLGLSFDSEDGGDMFLRNIGRLSREDSTLHNHRCENLKSYRSGMHNFKRILSLIALLRSFTSHRFRWSSSSKHDAFLNYGKQASKQASKEIDTRNGPQRKYHLGTDPKENITPLLSLPINRST
jgi:hypothetical protein